MKAEHLELAKKMFVGCGVGITAEGKCHLGAAIGALYISEKVDYWVPCVQKLSIIAKIHPHVVPLPMVLLVSAWNYFITISV